MKSLRFITGLVLCFAMSGAAADTYGPVKPKDGLYRIALELKYPGVTTSQMMIAIFRVNPDAFDRSNINRLEAGATLTIPDQAFTEAISHAEARAEIVRHNEAFRSGGKAVAASSAASVEPAATAARLPAPAPSVPSAPSVDAVNRVAPAVTPESEQPVAQVGLPEPATVSEPAVLPEPAIESETAALPEPAAETTKRRAHDKRPLFRYSYDIAVAQDDNIRLAQNDSDIREDTIYSATLKARAGRSLDSHTILNFGGLVGYNRFDTFDQLNHTEIEANVKYRFALSSGFTSPIYSLGAKLGGLEFDSEMRDSTLLTLSAEMNKWLTTTINLTTGLQWRERDAVSEVFDTSEARVFVNFDTELSKRDLVYTTLTFIDGDVVSSAEPTLDIINVSDAIEPDDAFGGIDANQFAYRIDAETWVVTLGYNRIMSPSWSLDFSARFIDSEAKEYDAIGYQRQILRASILGRF